MCPVSKSRPKKKRKHKASKSQADNSHRSQGEFPAKQDIFAALENDDPDALLAVIGELNPLRFRAMLADGGTLGLVGLAAMSGAWECLLELIGDRPRYRSWIGEIGQSLLMQLAEDEDIMEEVIEIAAANGNQVAINIFELHNYDTFKNFDADGRSLMAQRYDGNPLATKIFAQVIADEEREQMDHDESIFSPAHEHKPIKDTGGLF